MISEFARLSEIVRRRWFAALIVCIVGLAATPFALRLLPVYKGEANLLIVSQALKDSSLQDPDLPSIVTSTAVLGVVIDQLKLHTDAAALAKMMKTKLPPKSSVLEVTYRDSDGDRAAAVANAVADESVRYFHDIATRGYKDVIVALNKRLEDSRAVIASYDKRLQKASAENGFASSDKALDDLASQMNDLQSQRAADAATFAADQATAAALGGQLSRISPIVRGEILQKDVVYQQVAQGLAKDRADLISQRSSFRDSFPGLASLSNRVEREQRQVNQTASSAVQDGAGESASYTQTFLDRERANAVVDADRERLRATDDELANEQSHLRKVAGAGATVGTLRAERDAALQQYVGLIQRLSTAQADSAQAASLGTLVVVSRAIPGTNDLLLFSAALVAVVLLLSIGAAYIVDVVDRRYWNWSDIERVYGRRVFATVGVKR